MSNKSKAKRSSVIIGLLLGVVAIFFFLSTFLMMGQA